MENDLISRSKLKEAYFKAINETSIGEVSIISLIDNAPTVERPQGEWIDTENMEEYWAEEYQCSICGAKNHWHNYCPNCGAKLKQV